ncbi:MAG: hypothetical protein GF309_02040 [Candidatus Lokiarchaeota archaeon]|nr:hypothetical protein [Candidatus Lokiarchaeota archaeon]
MSEAKFRKFISELEFDEGAIYHNGQRLWLASTDWIANLQKRMEETLGTNGAYAIIYEASSEGGRQLGKGLAKRFEGLPIEKQIQAYFDFATMRGLGRITVEEFQLEPFRLVVKGEKSYIKGIITDADEGHCYMTAGFSTIIEGLLAAQGIQKELKQDETKCVSMGHNHCEFLITEK